MYVPREALQQLYQKAYKDEAHDDPDLSVCTSPDRPLRKDVMMMQMMPCRLPAVSLKVQHRGRL